MRCIVPKQLGLVPVFRRARGRRQARRSSARARPACGGWRSLPGIRVAVRARRRTVSRWLLGRAPARRTRSVRVRRKVYRRARPGVDVARPFKRSGAEEDQRFAISRTLLSARSASTRRDADHPSHLRRRSCSSIKRRLSAISVSIALEHRLRSTRFGFRPAPLPNTLVALDGVLQVVDEPTGIVPESDVLIRGQKRRLIQSGHKHLASVGE